MVTYRLDEILLAALAVVLWGADDFDAIALPSLEYVTYMAEMMNEGWTVQPTQTRDAGKEFIRPRSAPAP
jgi:hypothetical protein